MEIPVPRAATLNPQDIPLVLFTNGCCEPMGSEIKVGIGALIIDRRDDTCEAWGSWLNKEAVEFLRKEVGADQLVGQAELLPAIGARHAWPGRVYQRSVIHFVDNESAKFGLISGYSHSRASA